MHSRIAHRNITVCTVIFIVICILLCVLLLLVNKQPGKEDIVLLAKQYLGTPYHYGGCTPAGFDCSGYIMFLFHQYGKDLPRTADQQATIGHPVTIDKLRPGDVVFFATTDEPIITHTGLYIGNQQFIHASSSARKIVISNLNEPYWQKAFRGARQVISGKRD